MKNATILLVLSFALILSACAPAASPTPQAPAALGTRGVTAQGNLEPQSFLNISFSRAGQVSEILVVEMQAVKAGDVLARLGNTESLQAEYLRAQNEVENASLALKALEDAARVQLAQSELQVVLAEQQLEQAREALDELNEQDEPDALELSAAQARLKLAQETLAFNQASLKDLQGDNTSLRPAQLRLQNAQAALTAVEASLQAHELVAPLDGVVVGLNLKVGEFIAAGQPALTLADFSTWVIKTSDLTELEVVRISPGQAVTLRFDALPDLTLRGTVSQIDPRGLERRGDITYTATILLNDSTEDLRWGMTAAVEFEE